jgi:hypothetical protein
LIWIKALDAAADDNVTPRSVLSALPVKYRQPEVLAGMRAWLAWRLRAKSMRYQRPDRFPCVNLSGRRSDAAGQLRGGIREWDGALARGADGSASFCLY